MKCDCADCKVRRAKFISQKDWVGKPYDHALLNLLDDINKLKDELGILQGRLDELKLPEEPPDHLIFKI